MTLGTSLGITPEQGRAVIAPDDGLVSAVGVSGENSDDEAAAVAGIESAGLVGPPD